MPAEGPSVSGSPALASDSLSYCVGPSGTWIHSILSAEDEAG